MSPSSEFQLQFLNKIQLLLESGKFTSTYKFALLIALTNVAVEKGNDSGEALDVDLNDVAREFLSLYWSQARPYKSIGSTLLQNREVKKSAKIISLLAPEVAVSASQHARLRRYNKSRDALVNQARRLIVKFPLKHLQHFESASDQKYSRDQFLYELSDDDANNLSLDKIKLKLGVAACLRSLRGVIVALVQARWAQWVRATNPALGKDRELEAFMFGQDRQPLAHLAPRLYEIQNGKCFYTGKTLASPKDAQVDHFIAWARYACNDPLNLVLASSAVNNDKSDHIASTRHVQQWVLRNKNQADDLLQGDLPHTVNENSFASCLSIAHWAYSRAAALETPAWDAPKKLVKLDNDWRRLLAS